MSDIDAARSVSDLSEEERFDANCLAAAYEALTVNRSGPWHDLTDPECAAKVLAAANYLRAARGIGWTLDLPLKDRRSPEEIERALVEMEEADWGLSDDGP